MYYLDKIEALKDIFGTERIEVEVDRIIIDNQSYPIVDDVIILLHPSHYPLTLKEMMKISDDEYKDPHNVFAFDIQYTFGEEWKTFPKILPEYAKTFSKYFDLVDVSSLRNHRVCDLGCGSGRWSYFLKDTCQEIVLVDFSDAIFIARDNLREVRNAFFFMCDLKSLPFRDNFADLMFSLGVLHHLPTDALHEVRILKRYAPKLLIYLYYALDNRPFYFRALLHFVTVARLIFSRIKSSPIRRFIAWISAAGVYLPCISIGKILKTVGLSHMVPLYEEYHDKSFEQIQHDAYDRFLTRIEHRVSRNEIMALRDTFSEVIISEHIPYWHFICMR